MTHFEAECFIVRKEWEGIYDPNKLRVTRARIISP